MPNLQPAMSFLCRSCSASPLLPLLSRPRPHWPFVTPSQPASPRTFSLSHHPSAPKTPAQERAIRVRSMAKRRAKLAGDQPQSPSPAYNRPPRASPPRRLDERQARFHLSNELRKLQAAANAKGGADTSIWLKAENLFNNALPSHRRIVIVYNQMIYLAFSAGKANRALELVQEMKKDGMFPTCYTLSTVFRGLTASPLRSSSARSQLQTLSSDLRTLQPHREGGFDLTLDGSSTATRHVTPSRLRTSRQEAQLEASLEPRSFDIAACALVEALCAIDDLDSAWAWLTDVGHAATLAERRAREMDERQRSRSRAPGGYRPPLPDQLIAAYVKGCARVNRIDDIDAERVQQVWTSVERRERAVEPSLVIAEHVLAIAIKTNADPTLAPLATSIVAFVIERLEEATAKPQAVMPPASLLRTAIEQLKLQPDAPSTHAKRQRLKQGLQAVLGGGRLRGQTEPERIELAKAALMTLVQDRSDDVGAAERALIMAREGAQLREKGRWMSLFSMAMLVVARSGSWDAALRVLEKRKDVVASAAKPRNDQERTTQSDSLIVLRAFETALAGEKGKRRTTRAARDAISSISDLCSDTALVKTLFAGEVRGEELSSLLETAGNAAWHAGTLQRVLTAALDTGAKGADVAGKEDVAAWKAALAGVRDVQKRLGERAQE